MAYKNRFLGFLVLFVLNAMSLLGFSDFRFYCLLKCFWFLMKYNRYFCEKYIIVLPKTMRC